MDKVVMKKRLSIFSLLLSTMCCSFLPVQTNAAEATLQAVEQVEIDKFLGVWYEIARKPTSLEKNVVEILLRPIHSMNMGICRLSSNVLMRINN